MDEMNLPKLSKAMSQKLKVPVEFVSAEAVGRGYHAEGFKLTTKEGQHYFMKRISSMVSGFEYPERKVFSLMVGHGMAKRANSAPLPMGLLVETDGAVEAVPEISHDTLVYHIQEFESEGKAYSAILSEREAKTAVDAEDRLEIENIIDYLSRIHAIKYPSRDKRELDQVYNDGLRAELVHPEVTMPFLHEIEDDHPIIPIEKQGEYLVIVLKLIRAWRNRSDRLCALHGDFWGANVFLRRDSSVWVIDYSRIPWGDPGVDVGKWMSYYLYYYYKTNNAYYKELGNIFLETYIKKTGDEEILRSASFGFVFAGVLYASLDPFPNMDMEVRKKVFDHIWSILKNNRFSWEVEK